MAVGTSACTCILGHKQVSAEVKHMSQCVYVAKIKMKGRGGSRPVHVCACVCPPFASVRHGSVVPYHEVGTAIPQRSLAQSLNPTVVGPGLLLLSGWGGTPSPSLVDREKDLHGIATLIQTRAVPCSKPESPHIDTRTMSTTRMRTAHSAQRTAHSTQHTAHGRVRRTSRRRCRRPPRS